MKTKILFLVLFLAYAELTNAQLTLNYVYNTDPAQGFVKLSLSGLKYFYLNRGTSGSFTYFKLYNPDHSLFKTITIPPFPGKDCNKISYISETLFDTDTLVEYIAGYVFNGPGGIAAVRICNENGNILLERDTAGTGGAVGWLDNGEGGQTIFPDGTNTKLIVGKSYYSGSWTSTTEIYDLPGQLACMECSNGLVSGLVQQQPAGQSHKSTAYPNPFTNSVKIKYILPENCQHAFINIYDFTGKLIKKKEIDNHFNEVYISNDEIKQGAYFYQVIADDKIISGNKIIKI